MPPLPPPCRRGPSAALPHTGRGDAGYNLVILIMALAVMNILVAAVLPAWSTAIRREKEEELIFRGWQYAEAIRVFRNRHNGALPTKLEQLIEVEPRCIRRLWKDPMTEDGKWVPIFQGQPLPVGDEEPPGGGPGGQLGGGLPRPPGAPAGFDPEGGGNGEVVAVGPIIGVRSRSSEKSVLKLFDKERYDRWYFTVDLLVGGRVQVPGAAVPTGQAVVLSTRWLGRPIRPEFAAMVGGLPPGAQFNNQQQGGQQGGLGGPRGQRQPPPGSPPRPPGPPPGEQ